jgi:hypothetical protein
MFTKTLVGAAVGLTVAAGTALAGDIVVRQTGGDTFHYSLATPGSGRADTGRDRILRDAQKLAKAMGADGYTVVSESAQHVGGAVVRHVDIKLTGGSRR